MMEYEKFIDWYDNGPGSETFKRKVHRSNMEYQVRAIERLRELESIERRHAELVGLVENWKKAHNAMIGVYNTPADTEEESKLWNAEWERIKPVLDEAEAALREYGRTT
jgi:formiminotetrahydrofolate cyclodeaminase